MAAPPNPLRRNEASRRAILDASLQLCAELGYRRLTIEAIAARAGVSKKTIYRWWPSKGAVVLEAVDDVATTVTEHPNTGDLAADLHTQLTAVIGLLTPAETSAAVGLIAEALHDEELARDLRERIIRPRIDEFKERLRQAQRDGQLPADADLDVALDLIYGPLYHRLVFHLGLPGPDELRTLLAHALRAFGPPPR
ncbi:TetR/AcrR family transcriptional regulator [Amorphoplanes digitatis]|uniref:AcrR family transcriptional regulator n=1 Tax=Actinoplanes digitatis TaxID=1868 RepID=A0A7W7MTH3_9ACTN|nr:TetR/AcrR family transcriptional regulator [Actinoplanes digitatis]MBB4765785.1 AcrR family transcriptional regulator [Actinoplanes digitatis]BFE75695.1 TetR/AcrR family transcriptional regulator [Actinoplanes digitatis]GID93423.1 TetR family transcriptional regulator [Actinoplanes digitatis]